VGTTFRWTVRVLGRRLESTAVVTEYLPNARLGYRSTSGPIRYRSCRLFEASGGGTHLTRIDEMDVSGSFKVLEPIVARVARRSLELELAYLKSLFEARRTDRPDRSPALPPG
jgi:hypothetical protein